MADNFKSRSIKPGIPGTDAAVISEISFMIAREFHMSVRQFEK
jgi:hypothetical protein